MHERSLVRTLIKQARELQVQRSADRVVALSVSVGEFSGVDAELFRSAFEELVADSPISGARLELREIRMEARCQSCASEFAVIDFRFQCPQCDARRVDVVRGEGLTLESVTLEGEE